MCTTFRPYWTIALCWTVGVASAANKTDKVDRVVDAVLRQETRGAVNRRASDLGDLVGQSDRARWAAGYVHNADGWQIFDAVMPADDRLREYEQRRGTEPLTAEQHLTLANWCRDRKLQEQERAHLWASVASNRHPTLLRRLGFELIEGEWLSAEDQRFREIHDQSKIQHRNKWLTKSKSIFRQLSSSNARIQEAGRQFLMSIDDPDAISTLERELCSTDPDIANEFVQFAGGQRNQEGTRALMRQSVMSPWEPVRTAAADLLRSRRSDQYVPALLETVSTPIDMRSDRYRTGTNQFGALGFAATYDLVSFRQEKYHVERQLVLRRVHPVIEYGRMGIVTVLPTFYSGNGEQQLADLNETIRRSGADSWERVVDDLRERNRTIELWNQRVSATLTRAADFPPNMSPQELWNQWTLETHTQADPIKPVLTAFRQEISEAEVRFNPQNPSCLPAATLIVTRGGLRPIESIQLGDVVLAKNIGTGELSYKPVVLTTVRSPQPLVTLHTKDDNIRATQGHYFWVSGKGWRMGKEIKSGDRLHGVQGTVTVTDVSRGGREAVYNLVVEGANTYFVGEGKILSHDVTPPVPTDIVVPGLAAR